MSRRRIAGLVAVAVVALTAGASAAAVTSAMADDPPPVVVPLGPGDVTVRIDVAHSRFVPDELSVVAGTRVRFLIDNADPIHHELITGGPEVHARHATGTESEHPAIPGEVSVGPNGQAMTTFTFEEIGTFEFACHLPGHYEYGMHGTIEVVAPAEPPG